MKQYWQSMNERERLMVSIAGITLLLYLFYMLLFAPLNRAVDNKSQRYINKQETLHWMESAEKQYQQNAPKKSINNGQLLSLLATQLKEKKLARFNQQLEQTGSGDIQLIFETVPFELLASWLQALLKQYQLNIKQMTLEKTDTPGVTKAVLILTAQS